MKQLANNKIHTGSTVQWFIGSGLPWRIGVVDQMGEYSAWVTWRDSCGIEASAWVMLENLRKVP